MSRELTLIQQDEICLGDRHCYEWRQLGDLQPAWGFGSSEQEAYGDAVYKESAAERGECQSRYLGFGNFKIRTSIYENCDGYACLTESELLRDGEVIASYRDPSM